MLDNGSMVYSSPTGGDTKSTLGLTNVPDFNPRPALNAKQAAGGVWYSDGLATGSTGLSFGTHDFSLTGVVRESDYTPASAITLIQTHSTGNNRVQLTIETDGDWRLTFTDNAAATATYDITPTGLVDGIIYHFAIIADRSGNATLYIDGEASGTPVDISGSSAIDIGNGNANGYTVRIQNSFAPFNRALSAAEVATLYDHGLAAIPEIDSMDLQESADHGLGTLAFFGATTVGAWAVFAPRYATKVLAYNPATNILQESAAHDLGTSAFSAATTVGDWAVFSPYNSTKVLAYNPATNTLQESAAHGLGTSAFFSATTVGDWAVFTPYNSTKVLAYNPVTNTLQESAAHGLGMYAFFSVTTVGDWAVFAPRRSTKVLAYNPVTNTLQESAAHGLGTDAFYGATTVGNWAVFAPYNSTKVLAYNPVTDTLQESVAHGLGADAFSRATTVGDWAVFAPQNASQVLAYNPATNTLQESAAHGLGAGAFEGATTVGDWAVFAPRDAAKVLAYNPVTNTLQESAAHGLGTFAFYGATTVGDWAVFAPRNSSKVLSLKPPAIKLALPMDEGIGPQLHDVSPNGYHATLSGGYKHLLPKPLGIIRASDVDASAATYMLRADDILEGDTVVDTVVVDGEVLHPTGSQTLGYQRIRLAPSGADLLVQRSDGTTHETLVTATPASLSSVDVQIKFQKV